MTQTVTWKPLGAGNFKVFLPRFSCRFFLPSLRQGILQKVDLRTRFLLSMIESLPQSRSGVSLESHEKVQNRYRPQTSNTVQKPKRQHETSPGTPNSKASKIIKIHVFLLLPVLLTSEWNTENLKSRAQCEGPPLCRWPWRTKRATWLASPSSTSGKPSGAETCPGIGYDKLLIKGPRMCLQLFTYSCRDCKRENEKNKPCYNYSVVCVDRMLIQRRFAIFFCRMFNQIARILHCSWAARKMLTLTGSHGFRTMITGGLMVGLLCLEEQLWNCGHGSNLHEPSIWGLSQTVTSFDSWRKQVINLTWTLVILAP